MILTTGALFQAEDNRWFLINHHARFLAAFDFDFKHQNDTDGIYSD